jgi:hypothetical protein
MREPLVLRVTVHQQQELAKEKLSLLLDSKPAPEPVARWDKEVLLGSGSFEGGQSDALVMDKRVTASSVILAMLACDPGPVVVHYVSLQPEIGFTVHLTAPAAATTLFNYVIFRGES